MPGIIGGIPCVGGIMPLIGIMLLVTCNRKEVLLKETCLQHG